MFRSRVCRDFRTSWYAIYNWSELVSRSLWVGRSGFKTLVVKQSIYALRERERERERKKRSAANTNSHSHNLIKIYVCYTLTFLLFIKMKTTLTSFLCGFETSLPQGK